jgi:DNA-binding NtrC family response regulator
MRATLLIVDDERPFLELYSAVLEAAGFTTVTARDAKEALAKIHREHPDLVLSDVRMPGTSGLELLESMRRAGQDIPFLLVTAEPDVRDAVSAMKLGAVDYLGKPVDLDELVAAIRDTLGMRHSHADADSGPVPDDIVAESPSMRALLADAARVAQSNISVLITGESGSGKELVARYLHQQSERSIGPLVPVNCAAIPGNLVASELFGHDKGAFTGADHARPGHFRSAARGTLFLDEIGELPIEVQPAFLRVLETGRIVPVGTSIEIDVDFRLIAATHRNLATAVADGRFRQDLYYRIAVVELRVPPLRERPEDIQALARRMLRTSGHRLTRRASQALLTHSWPGNVRELANALEHARLLAPSEVIDVEQLPPSLREENAIQEERNHQPAPLPTLEESEIASIRKALEQTAGNRTHAARLLGITRRGLIYKIKRFGLE